jgi:hypothetical protein
MPGTPGKNHRRVVTAFEKIGYDVERESAHIIEVLRQFGKPRIAELEAECEKEALEYYVCAFAPKLIQPLVATE